MHRDFYGSDEYFIFIFMGVTVYDLSRKARLLTLRDLIFRGKRNYFSKSRRFMLDSVFYHLSKNKLSLIATAIDN